MCSSKAIHPGGIIEQKVTPKPLQKLLPSNGIKKLTGESKPAQTMLTAPAMMAAQPANPADMFPMTA